MGDAGVPVVAMLGRVCDIGSFSQSYMSTPLVSSV